MSADGEIGILTYLSKTKGIGGAIKENPADFLVEEITPKGVVLEIGRHQEFQDSEGEYTHFTLEKNNWDTIRALKTVARACNVSQKRLNFAGTKDRRAISTQRVSAWNVPRETLEKVSVKDLQLRDFSKASQPINLGDLIGNRFTAVIHGAPKDAEKAVKKIVEELDGKTPNFFGSQRFGLRLNNHKVGKLIIKGDFEGAMTSYLCDTGGEPEKATRAREELRETKDFKKAFQEFPKYLGMEKSVLNHLSKTPNDYIGAMRVLPKKLRWLFIHAYQGYIFNLALSRYIESGKIPDELPQVGYTTKPDEVTTAVLEGEGMKPEEFKIKPMPEMSFEGASRKSLVEFKEFEILGFNETDSNITLRFVLPPGAYATVLLRELMK